MVIVNGVVHPVDRPVIRTGFVAWEQDRITAVGPMSELPADVGETLDAAGAHIFPGLIDAHTHLGLFPDGGPYDEARFTAPGPGAPEFSPLCALDAQDRGFFEALCAGVTTVVTGPGSARPVGGQLIAMKTDGRVLRAPVALKLALGETPERALGTDAAGLAALLQKNFASATDGPLAAAKGGALPVHVHVHRADDIRAALDLADAFGLRLVLVHGTEAPRLADRLAKDGVGVITGPALTDRSRAELKELSTELPASLLATGVKVAICTDHPETPAKFLALCAALAIRGGMSEDEALAAVTLAPAELLGLDGELGSLTPGKQADIVVAPGHLLDVTKQPSAVFLGGKRVV